MKNALILLIIPVIGFSQILTDKDSYSIDVTDFEIIEITTEDSRNRIEKMLQGGIELFQSFGRRTSLEDSEIPGLIR